jgi:prepilin-type N-terminal cleavage/methylation domain-containing protein
MKNNVMAMHNKQGFTLMELVISIVVLSILGVFTFSYLFTGIQVFNATHGSQVLHEETGLAIERCVREARDAITATPGSGTITLTKAHTTPQDTRTVVTYRQSSTILQRGDAGVGYAPLSQDLVSGTGFTVTYDNNGTPSTTGDDAWKFKFSLITQNGVAVTRSAFVSPRNIPWNADPLNFDSHYKGRTYQGDYQDAVQ